MGRIQVSIMLSKENLERLDKLRGSVSRSDYVACLIKEREPSGISFEPLIRALSECVTLIKAYIAGDRDDPVKRLQIYDSVMSLPGKVGELIGNAEGG